MLKAGSFPTASTTMWNTMPRISMYIIVMCTHDYLYILLFQVTNESRWETPMVSGQVTTVYLIVVKQFDTGLTNQSVIKSKNFFFNTYFTENNLSRLSAN